jgi:hypothetical protein
MPVLEFTRQSWRASGIAPLTRYRYSLEPCRLVELVWPNVYGMSASENHSWLEAVPPAGTHEIWVKSLYLGCLTLSLALAAVGWKARPAWRVWMTTIVLVGLAASLGKFGSPLWWMRQGESASNFEVLNSGAVLPGSAPHFQDMVASPYGLLSSVLPGFSTFRYPSKLLVFAAAGLALLSGLGWDRVVAGDTKRLRCLCVTGVGASLGGLVLALSLRGGIVNYLVSRVPIDPMLGPPDIASAWSITQWALAHGAIMFPAVLALAWWAPRRPRVCGPLALLLLSVDLGVANAGLVSTVPQSDFESRSEAALRIEEVERSNPTPGQFRIHRMPGGWFPTQFASSRNTNRLSELILWARQTLCPLFALPLGFPYCAAMGSLEIDDYMAFFDPQEMPTPSGTAQILGVTPGSSVTYYPRRSFDLWGARYFILPTVPDWANSSRGFASFLNKTELIYPKAEVLHATNSVEGQPTWAASHDWQLRRNQAAYPRAWVVHIASIRPPARDVEARAHLMRTLAFMNDPIWTDNDRLVFDLRQAALIETQDSEALREYSPRTPVGPTEGVEVIKYEPQRVELKTSLERPGLVILADTYYPGWRLTIDGQVSPIYRGNRMMRAAAVPAGKHTLVYTYNPESVRMGLLISLVSLVIVLFLACPWSLTIIEPVRDGPVE